MKKTDFTRVLIEGTVRRTLNRLQEAPEREIRNLVDMGLNFSTGRFQTHFLEIAQNMLQNPNSSYYTIIKDTAWHVDQERLMAFGINLGYDSCTKGAKIIRQTEAERHFNIPWALSIALNEEKLSQEPAFYPGLFKQGKELGIYTYLLYLKEDASLAPALLQTQPDCAFILFLRGSQITPALIRLFETVKNVMICVHANDDMDEACGRLREARFLYAVYKPYSESSKEEILGGQWLQEILPCHPVFAFLLPDLSCSSQTREAVHSYILSIRDRHMYPVIPIDIRQDMMLIDRIVSDDICLAGFEETGNLCTHTGRYQSKEYNIFSNTLDDILRRTMAKE